MKKKTTKIVEVEEEEEVLSIRHELWSFVYSTSLKR